MFRKNYRLRQGPKILGYSKVEPRLAKSTELCPWDVFPKADALDAYVGVLDRFHRPVYEQDIVIFVVSSSKREERKGFVLYDELTMKFGVLDLETVIFFPLYVGEICLFEVEKLEIVSHAFTQPELKNRLVGVYLQEQ